MKSSAPVASVVSCWSFGFELMMLAGMMAHQHVGVKDFVLARQPPCTGPHEWEVCKKCVSSAPSQAFQVMLVFLIVS